MTKDESLALLEAAPPCDAHAGVTSVGACSECKKNMCPACVTTGLVIEPTCCASRPTYWHKACREKWNQRQMMFRAMYFFCFMGTSGFGAWHATS